MMPPGTFLSGGSGAVAAMPAAGSAASPRQGRYRSGHFRAAGLHRGGADAPDVSSPATPGPGGGRGRVSAPAPLRGAGRREWRPLPGEPERPGGLRGAARTHARPRYSQQPSTVPRRLLSTGSACAACSPARPRRSCDAAREELHLSWGGARSQQPGAAQEPARVPDPPQLQQGGRSGVAAGLG